MPKLTVGSLFSGIGGLELGLERAGMEVCWQVENDPYCIKVLEKHWPHVRRHTDIETFEGCDADLICGGFPCQPVSVAGKQGGDADDRWLWPQMRRVCSVVRPRWVLVENVPGLLSASAGRLFGGVVRDLATLRYAVEWDCISAANVGANHIRDRVFIIGRLANDEVREPRSVHGPGRRSGQGSSGGACGESGGHDHWESEPDVGRVAHGVPKRVDRLKCLGNAVVPQVAEFIGRMIVTADSNAL